MSARRTLDDKTPQLADACARKRGAVRRARLYRRTMRSLLWLAALVACGNGGNGSSDAAPTPTQFGLDARPSNTTCVAKQRPVLDTGVRLQRMFQGVTFA